MQSTTDQNEIDFGPKINCFQVHFLHIILSVALPLMCEITPICF